MEIGRHRGMPANEHIKIGSNSYEKEKTFKYLSSLLTNQNPIQKEIQCRLKAGNSCYYSVQTVKIYKKIIFPVVLYGFETWSLTLREECKLRVFENRILRRIFGPKKDESGEWRRLHNEELHSLYRSPKYSQGD